MEKREILNKAISILRGTMDFPDALIFEIEPLPTPIKPIMPGAIFMIQVGQGVEEEWNKLRKFKRGLIETKLQGKVFIAEVRQNAQPRFLRNAIFYLKKIKEKFPDYNLLIVTPYIGPGGRTLCRKEGISYIDTSGNIGIFLKEGFILKEGKESMKREKRELKSLFSPKSTRIIRIVLENPSKIWRLQELASISKVSLGQTYNVIKKLIDEEYMKKTPEGIKLSKPSELLDRWSSVYDVIQINRVESFYSGNDIYEALIKSLTGVAEKGNYFYAFTLFAGTSLIIPYVRTPHIHLYLSGDIEKFVQEANLKPVTSGGNVHILSPYDEGVFNPIQRIKNVRVAGNIQLYIDLFNYPARGREQAEVLRKEVIRF